MTTTFCSRKKQRTMFDKTPTLGWPDDRRQVAERKSRSHPHDVQTIVAVLALKPHFEQPRSNGNNVPSAIKRRL